MKKFLVILIILLSFNFVNGLEILSPISKNYEYNTDFYYNYITNKTVKEAYIKIDNNPEFKSTPFLLLTCNDSNMQDFSFYNHSSTTNTTCYNNLIIVNQTTNYIMNNNSNSWASSFNTANNYISVNLNNIQFSYVELYGMVFGWFTGDYDNIKLQIYPASKFTYSLGRWYPYGFSNPNLINYNSFYNESMILNLNDTPINFYNFYVFENGNLIHTAYRTQKLYNNNLPVVLGTTSLTYYNIYNLTSFTIFNESTYFKLPICQNHNLTVRIIYNDSTEEIKTVHFTNIPKINNFNIINKDFNTQLKIYTEEGAYIQDLDNEENINLCNMLNYTFVIYPTKALVLSQPKSSLNYIQKFIGFFFGIGLLIGLLIIIYVLLKEMF